MHYLCRRPIIAYNLWDLQYCVELKDELVKKGYYFLASNCDTEVNPMAWRLFLMASPPIFWWHVCFLLISSGKEKTLFVRVTVLVKSLFTILTEWWFFFASEMKVLWSAISRKMTTETPFTTNLCQAKIPSAPFTIQFLPLSHFFLYKFSGRKESSFRR